MRFFLFIIVTLFWISPSSAQDQIQWLTWEEALVKTKEEPRKIFVDIYTDWCGWCKKMDKTTFQKAHIAKYINENYYAVKFDAEQKEKVHFNGKDYKFMQQGRRGYHELAVFITRGQMSFPTVVFLDEQLNVIQAIPGYRESLELEMMMTYFGYDKHKTTPWSKYQKTYQPLPKASSTDENVIVKEDCP